MTTSEPYDPEPAPREPEYVERDVPTCPTCRGLVRRELVALTGQGQKHGPWRCDLHGEVTPVWETYEVPTGDAP